MRVGIRMNGKRGRPVEPHRGKKRLAQLRERGRRGWEVGLTPKTYRARIKALSRTIERIGTKIDQKEKAFSERTAVVANRMTENRNRKLRESLLRIARMNDEAYIIVDRQPEREKEIRHRYRYIEGWEIAVGNLLKKRGFLTEITQMTALKKTIFEESKEIIEKQTKLCENRLLLNQPLPSTAARKREMLETLRTYQRLLNQKKEAERVLVREDLITAAVVREIARIIPEDLGMTSGAR